MRKYIYKYLPLSLLKYWHKFFGPDFKGSTAITLLDDANFRSWNMFGFNWQDYRKWVARMKSFGADFMFCAIHNEKDHVPQWNPFEGGHWYGKLSDNWIKIITEKIRYAGGQGLGGVCTVQLDDAPSCKRVLQKDPAKFLELVQQIHKHFGWYFSAYMLALEVDEKWVSLQAIQPAVDYLKKKGVKYVGVHGTPKSYWGTDNLAGVTVHFHQFGWVGAGEVERQTKDGVARLAGRKIAFHATEWNRYSNDEAARKAAKDNGAIGTGN